ncbi:hypothetical protein BDR05DRAFT_313957 [Suillus weaverae]|nr:hypothetical protein BDR05DRAFT_313957 [Suillus weaverae]
MNILPPCGHGLGGIEDTALHQFVITSRIILQTRFPASAVASSEEYVDICDALEIVQLSLFAQHVLLSFSTPSTVPHVPLLMPFLFSACFPSSHDPCISHPTTYSIFKILHVNFFIFLIPSFFSFLFVHSFLLVDAT